MYEEYLSNPNVRAGLDVLAYCEGANYNTLFGGGTFSDFSRHPNISIHAGGYTSTAAGRYQFLYSTWRGLGLSDFSPTNQDLGAVILIAQHGGLQALANGDLQTFVAAVRGVWPSLPGGSQQTRSWTAVANYFQSDLIAQGVGAPPDISLVAPPMPSPLNENNDSTLNLYDFAPASEHSDLANVAVVAAVLLAVFVLLGR